MFQQYRANLIFALMLTGFLFSAVPPTFATDQTLYPPLEMGAASEQIPTGAKIKIKMVTSLDSQNAHDGDVFLATTDEDLWAGKQLIIPRGTAVRGRVLSAERAKLFSKGGLLRLGFDHLVMPSGELKPMSLEINAATQKMSPEKNALYTDPGMGRKLDNSVDKGVEEFKSWRDKGVAAGQARGGGINMLLTVPTNAVAGVATGTAVTTVNAAKAVFGKGEIVTLMPGDILLLDFSQAARVQAQ